ncbi:B3 domain-containing transcription factor FUS3-like [Magnolia sinica]|uniref:B3 domain-containing transcription factor FUS3-like n=1 Tax=Magnolia sinica TaxID=86752 RepID=UPI0026585114|nr:B3 domain-containing transcription factor FUS3-like [Magnolia sinica]
MALAGINDCEFTRTMINYEIGFQKGAEAHLPILTSREGILMSMDDMDTSQVWSFKYRFWPNNKSRMYVLENTGEFVKSHGLRLGDFIMLYRDDHKQKYIIRAKKTLDREAPPASSKNGLFNANTADDQLVPNMGVSKSSYFHVNLPVTDEMCMGFLLNDAFSSEFLIDLWNGRLQSTTSFGSVENLSLDDFP